MSTDTQYICFELAIVAAYGASVLPIVSPITEEKIVSPKSTFQIGGNFILNFIR